MEIKNIKDIEQAQTMVENDLEAYRLGESINTLRDMVNAVGTPAQRDTLNQIEDTYRYMIHYLIEGTPDSGRDAMYDDLVERLLTLCDAVVRHQRAHTESDLYSSTLRMNRLKAEPLSALLESYRRQMAELSLAELGENDTTDMRREIEDTEERIFSTALTTADSPQDLSPIRETIISDAYPYSIKAQLISALSLSLHYAYSKGVLETLLDIYDSDIEAKLSARTLVGIVLATAAHRNRIRHDAALMRRMLFWQDSIETYRHLRETIRAIVSTRDTERVAAKMKDEVIPELMKLRPEMLNKIRESGGDMESLLMEANPEWQEKLDQSGLTRKMEELTEMQNDGADLMMVTFANLKQFPFFNKANAWFLPFDADRASIALDAEMRPLIEMLTENAGQICDSDKYSFVLGMKMMPEAQRKAVSGQFNAQFSQMREEIKSRTPQSTTPEFDIEVVKVVRDYYRFFKLYRNRQYLHDIFGEPFQFMTLPVIGDMMAGDEVLRIIGEFYFKRGFYAEALPLFVMLTESSNDDVALWEKIGYCRQREGNLQGALDAYRKAELLREPGPWLVKKLAQVSRRLGMYAEARKYYAQALDMEPDNVSLLLSAGNNALADNNPQEALNHYYHADYLTPSDVKIERNIAWAEFRNRNYDKSERYYSRILGETPTAADWLNSGHTALLAGRYKDAIERYREAAAGNMEGFEMTYLADLPTLTAQGLDPKVAYIILDKLRYY